ncbi:multi-sensor hybrid histidine kinase [Stylonychia lemnae]|uniref:histidine kinase n=1 Tax=Stylonychia lemnae TaxID=5949 RepID=A0A077ZXT7_STYLE|nr:multi-sensor hybrid histidine kinase [Stylonychia lemnae]|eukprot:CDW74726.1 multi-sensor hybrid histidine kinase [Stylonychia lemnae]
MGCTNSSHTVEVQRDVLENVATVKRQASFTIGDKQGWENDNIGKLQTNGSDISKDKVNNQNNNSQQNQSTTNDKRTENKKANKNGPAKTHQQELWELGDGSLNESLNPPGQNNTINRNQVQRNQNSNNRRAQVEDQPIPMDNISRDLMFYDENLFVEQAISQSLQDRNVVNEDAEFEKMLQQVLKDSKQEHDIKQRKVKEEELQMISKIPELRQQKIEQILSQAEQSKNSKLQPLQPLKKGYLAPLQTTNMPQQISKTNNLKITKPTDDITRSSINTTNEAQIKAVSTLQASWDNEVPTAQNKNKQNFQPEFTQTNQLKTVTYDNNKKKDKKYIGYNESWAHEGLKDNFDLDGSIDLDQFQLDSQKPKTKNLMVGNSLSKPSLQTTITQEVNIPSDLRHEELDLLTAYVIRQPEEESRNLQMSFIFLIGIFHIVFLWLSIITDKQRKLNFCNAYILKKQKENLMEILEFFPDCLLILDKNIDDSQILFQNQKMQQFIPVSQQLVWDQQLNLFVSSQNEEQIEHSQTIFETESDLKETQPGLLKDINLQIDQSQKNDDQKKTLFKFLKTCVYQQDRIKVQENASDQVEDSSEGNIKVFELKQKEVIFDMSSCRMLILRDISELVKGEYTRSIQKLTEVMVASTSHDMRTPLNTIINMHQLLEFRVNEPDLKQYLNIAKNSTDLLRYLVNDTLDFFQIKSGKFKIQKVMVKIKDMIEKCSELISFPMQQKKLQRIILIDQELQKHSFKFDEQRITQVIVNLLSNALKFTQKGYIKVSVKKIQDYPIKRLVKRHKNPANVQISGKLQSNLRHNSSSRSQFLNHQMVASQNLRVNQGKEDQSEIFTSNEYLSQMEEQFIKLVQLKFEVEDSGIGIKDEDQGKLFKMFGKISHSGDLNPHGIGLGLTICNKILCQHGSQLEVDSKYGEGTKFFFYIDIQQMAEQSELEKQFYSTFEGQHQFPLKTHDFILHRTDFKDLEKITPKQKAKRGSCVKEFDLLSSQEIKHKTKLRVPEFFENKEKYTNIYEMQREVDEQFEDLSDYPNKIASKINIERIDSFQEELKFESPEANLKQNKTISINDLEIQFETQQQYKNDCNLTKPVDQKKLKELLIKIGLMSHQ